jgi:hypothetical protein
LKSAGGLDVRKLISICVLLSMLTVLIPPPTGAALTMHQSLSTADIKISSYAANGGLGYSVALVGDVNGDGYGDYMATDTWNDSWMGDAYLFWGRNASFPTNAAQANVTFHAEGVGGLVERVAGLGDVNGDGFDDFIIGAPDVDKPVWDSGAAYIFFGHPGAWSKYMNVTSAQAIIRGTNMSDLVGISMAGVGDTNGDGRDDFVLGCYGRGGWGVTFLYLGRPIGSPAWNTSMNLTHADASFHGKEAKSLSGVSLAGGDVNGDGLDDIIIGSPGSDFVFDNYKSPGYTYVVFGRKAGWTKDLNLSTNANASLMGEHYDDYAGQSVAVPGDVNGDGFEDILVGTADNDEAANYAGKAYLYLGRASGWGMSTNLSGADASWRGEAANNKAGVPLSGAGDVNGDSLADFMIGAPINTDQGLTTQGQVYLFLGKKVGWAKNQNINTADASWLGEANTDWAPSALAGKGDVNGDVLDDLLIGSQNIGSLPGKIYLVFPVKNIRPTNITKVDLFMDAAMTKHATYVKLHDQIFVRLKAKDADPANVNFEQVRIRSTPHDQIGFVLDLAETGANTGIFTGNFFVQNYTQPDLRWIKALPICRVHVEAVKNITAYDEISVGGVLKVDSITVLPGGSPTLYAMKQSYSFRVNVTDQLGNDHIGGVFLYLPYPTGKINLTWYHDSHSFHTITNPDNIVVLDPTSFGTNPSENRSVVTFKIYFNWTFPDELYHTVEATVMTKDSDASSMNVIDAYRVEKHLDFYGNLKITGNHNRPLNNGAPLSPGENITMTNVIVVYQGTTNVYPANSQVTVVGIDSDGNNWTSTSTTGAFIWVVATPSLITNLHYNVTIDIWGPPRDCINRTIKLSFKVDAEQVAFSSPVPSQTEWQAHKRVNARVNISDAGGSLVNANSIEFRTKLNGAQWGPWTNAQMTDPLPYIEASIMVDLNDGPTNLVQWRATNGVGNLDVNGNKTTSPAYIIMVDTVPPVFSNPWPGPGNVSKRTNVTFGIKVTDLFSQVNGDSIAYTVSTDNQTTWTNWTKAVYNGSKQGFDCTASWTFLNSSLNFVRWKATDNVGNLVMSDPVRIVVDTTPPPPPNRKPVLQALTDRTVNVGSVLKFQVNATDPDKDQLNFSLLTHPQGMVITPKGLLTFAPTKDQEGVQNVTVMVSDGKLDDTASFKVMVVLLRPGITLTDPIGPLVDLKGTVTFKGTASGGQQGIQKIEWWSDSDAPQTAKGTTSWSLSLETKKLKDGDHQLNIRVTDGMGTTNTTTIAIKVKNKGGTHGGLADNMFIIVGAVVGIAVVGICIGAFVMLRKKKGPEQVPPSTDQQPSGGTPPPMPPK